MYYFNDSETLNQLLASLTQEKCALTQTGVLNHKSQQFQQHKVKTLKESNKLAKVIMSHIQTNNEAGFAGFCQSGFNRG